jgi:hypothetical protein
MDIKFPKSSTALLSKDDALTHMSLLEAAKAFVQRSASATAAAADGGNATCLGDDDGLVALTDALIKNTLQISTNKNFPDYTFWLDVIDSLFSADGKRRSINTYKTHMSRNWSIKSLLSPQQTLLPFPSHPSHETCGGGPAEKAEEAATSSAGEAKTKVTAVDGGSFVAGQNSYSLVRNVSDESHRLFVVASLEFLSKLLFVCEKKKFFVDKIHYILELMKQTLDYEISELACKCLFNWCSPRHQSVLEVKTDSNHEVMFIPLATATNVLDIFMGLGFCSFEYGIFDYIRGSVPAGFNEKEGGSRTLNLQIGTNKALLLDVKSDDLSSLNSYILNPLTDVNDSTIVSYSLVAIHTLLSGDAEARLKLVKFRLMCLYILLQCPSLANPDFREFRATTVKLFSSESIVLKEIVTLCNPSADIYSGIDRSDVGSLSESAMQCVLFILYQIKQERAGRENSNMQCEPYTDVCFSVVREIGLNRDYLQGLQGRNRSFDQGDQGDSIFISILSSVLVAASSLIYDDTSTGDGVNPSSALNATHASYKYIHLGLELLLAGFHFLGVNENEQNPSLINNSNLSFRALVPQLIEVINSLYPVLQKIVDSIDGKTSFDCTSGRQNFERQLVSIIPKCCACLWYYLDCFGGRHRQDDGSATIVSVMTESKLNDTLLKVMELFSSKIEIILSSDCYLRHSFTFALENVVLLFSKYLRHIYRQSQFNITESGVSQLKTPFFYEILTYLFSELREGQENLWAEFLVLLKDMMYMDTPFIKELVVSTYFSRLIKNAHYSKLHPNMAIFSKNPILQADIVVLSLCKFAVNCAVITEGQNAIKNGFIEFIIESTIHTSLLSSKEVFLNEIGKQLLNFVSVNEFKELILTTFINKIGELCDALEKIWLTSRSESNYDSEYMLILQKVSNICYVFDSFLKYYSRPGSQQVPIRLDVLGNALLPKLIGAYWCSFPHANQLFTQIALRGDVSGFSPAIKSINNLVKRILEMSFTGGPISVTHIKKVVHTITKTVASRLNLISKYSQLVLREGSASAPSTPLDISIDLSVSKAASQKDEEVEVVDITGFIDKLPSQCFSPSSRSEPNGDLFSGENEKNISFLQ